VRVFLLPRIPNAAVMKVVSVNVGKPQSVSWRGETYQTGIFKTPVGEPILAVSNGLQGDVQADRRVHGGRDKALYAYSAAHYTYWQERLASPDLPWGAFGENLTLSAWDETSIRLGDQFRIGQCEAMVTGPRVPCFKLEAKFGIDGLARQFSQSLRSGCYLMIWKPGLIAMGDSVSLLQSDIEAPTVMEVFRAFISERTDAQTLQRLALSPFVSDEWRELFEDKLRFSFGAGGA
jgi:MOSC domain-containing protein YiiM